MVCVRGNILKKRGDFNGGKRGDLDDEFRLIGVDVICQSAFVSRSSLKKMKQMTSDE
jgi:hypothetical protein